MANETIKLNVGDCINGRIVAMYVVSGEFKNIATFTKLSHAGNLCQFIKKRGGTPKIVTIYGILRDDHCCMGLSEESGSVRDLTKSWTDACNNTALVDQVSLDLQATLFAAFAG